MMLSTAFTASLAPLAVLASPIPDATPNAARRVLERRTCTAVTTADVIYRTAPSVKATAIGQYPPGHKITIHCHTTSTEVEGDNLWYKMTNGYYIWDGPLTEFSSGNVDLPQC